MVTTVAGVCDILFGMRRCMINLPNRCQRLISRAEWHTVRLKGASGESEGLRRYDKENLLWQSGLTLLVPSEEYRRIFFMCNLFATRVYTG